MSRSSKGATSVAPAPTITSAELDQWEADARVLLDAVGNVADAERLLANVTVAEQAMRIAKLGGDRAARWTRLRLQAERRYGELLGPAVRGRPKRNLAGDKISSIESDARIKARRVAAVPQGTFDAYITNEPSPSRTGLLRNTPKTSNSPPRNPKPWENEAIIAWAAKRLASGATITDLWDDAKTVSYQWPGGPLGEDGAGRVAAVAIDRARRNGSAPKRPVKEGARRVRQLYAERKAGRPDGQQSLWKMQLAVAQAVAVLEQFELPDLDWNEETEMLVAEIYEDLERHACWVDAAINATIAHMDVLGRQRKLKALRARANDASSTPAERANAARLAEKFSRRQRSSRLGNGGA